MNDLSLEIDKIVELIENGKTTILPTDTICGISCDALNENAINKIYKIKNRAKDKPLILLLKSKNELSKYFESLTPTVLQKIETIKEPTTFILPNAKRVLPNMLKSKNNSVAIRIPKDGIVLELLQRLKNPITSTSANLSTKPTPTFFYEIEEEIKQKVDYVFPYKKFIKENDKAITKSSKIVLVNVDGKFTEIRS